MLIRPVAEDFRLVAYYLGRILLVVAVSGLLPLGWAVARGEWAPAGDFLFMIGLTAALGATSLHLRPPRRQLDWSHGMVVVALTWLVVPALGAIPLALSGHYALPLDPYFDAMSGLTTTGLALVQDLDHIADSLNVWRHLLHFLGGQGIVLAVLMFFGGRGARTLYYGEARDERILPSVGSTARFIWKVSAFHGVLGVLALGLVAWLTLGFSPYRALFHGINIFMAAFDTGGFSPQSSSLQYYHSAVFEGVTAVLMVAGAMSFGVHFALWRGPRRVLRNLETRTILATLGMTLLATLIGLVVTGFYVEAGALTRRGFFQVLSAHTGTGFSTVSTAALASWGGLAFAGMATAMALGGMASSTAGGVKALRVGLTVKSLNGQIKDLLLPESAVISDHYWQNGLRRLTPQVAQAVMAASLLYVGLYLLGAAVGAAYGYPLDHALFESVSAGANVGLSVGVTEPGMPLVLKLIYIGQMWAGRLEFVAAFSLVGFVIAWLVGE